MREPLVGQHPVAEQAEDSKNRFLCKIVGGGRKKSDKKKKKKKKKIRLVRKAKETERQL